MIQTVSFVGVVLSAWRFLKVVVFSFGFPIFFLTLSPRHNVTTDP